MEIRGDYPVNQPRVVLGREWASSMGCWATAAGLEVALAADKVKLGDSGEVPRLEA